MKSNADKLKKEDKKYKKINYKICLIRTSKKIKNACKQQQIISSVK